MAKRKVESEEELESSSSHSTAPPVKKNKKPTSGDNFESEDNNETRESNSDSNEKLPSTKDAKAVEISRSADGESYINLGKKRRVTVRKFKNQPLIDIREFYGPDGDEKPGKKGISLTPDQWELLKQSMSTIDNLLS